MSDTKQREFDARAEARNWLLREPSFIVDGICNGPENRLTYLLQRAYAAGVAAALKKAGKTA